MPFWDLLRTKVAAAAVLTMAERRQPRLRAGRLLELAVSDLALIDRLRLPLAAGLNVLTGETGAGKSLLIDALGLATGARADTTLVRHGAESARVEALFDRVPEPLIAVREVSAAGRSHRAPGRRDGHGRAGSRSRPAALVEIHGQHDQQRLLDEDWQRDLLDAFGGHGGRAGDGGRRRSSAGGRTGPRSRSWRWTRASCCGASRSLEHEAAEIEAGGCARARRTRSRASWRPPSTARRSPRARSTVRDTLLGEGAGPASASRARSTSCGRWPASTHRWAPLADRLAGLEAEVEDVAAEVRALAETVDHDPATLARARGPAGRRSTALLRRYGDDEAAVIAHGERAAAEAARLRGLEDERALRAARGRTPAPRGRRCRGPAVDPSATATADELGRAVSAVLAELGFPADAFAVAMGRRPAARDDPAVEVDGDAVAFDATGHRHGRVHLPAPTRASRPGRWRGSRRAASCRASRWRSSRSWPRPTRRRRSCSTRSTPGSAAAARTRSGRSLWTLARDAPGAVRHAPAADRRLRRRALPDREARARRPHRDRDRRRSTARRARSSSPRCSAGPTAARRPLASARELLDRAEAWRAGRAVGAGA